MTLLHYDGFDLGDLLYQDYVQDLSPSYGLVSTTPYNQGRALQMNGGILGKNVPATTEIYSGWTMFYYGGGQVNQSGIFSVVGDGATVGHITLGVTAAGIYARLGGNGGAIITPVGGWTAPTAGWKHVQVYIKVADSGGRVVIKVDDLTVVDFTGDTRNGGSGTIDQVRLWRADGGGAFYYDDWWITDAAGPAPYNGFLGMARCRLQSPTGPGATTGFTPSTAPNWDCVNEQPFVATDYVSNAGPVSGTRDTYATADLPTAGIEVLAVKSLSVAKKTGPGLISVKPTIRSAGTDYYGPAVPLPAADKTASSVWLTDPATSAAWTLAGVNAAEVGFEVA